MNNKPKRILHVVTYMGRGGIETMLMNYYRHIDRNVLQFDFLVHRDFKADFDDEIESLGGKIYRVPPMNPLKYSYWKSIINFFKSHTYETVHCHLNYKSGIVLAAAKIAKVPVRIAHAHTASMSFGLAKLARILMKPLIPLTATNFQACSINAGEAIFNKKPFIVVPNAIDIEVYSFNENKRQLMRKKLGVEDRFTILHVGRFTKEKNHMFLIDIFFELLNKNPNSKLLLVGDGPLKNEIMLKTNQFPKGTVEFLGVRNDVPDIMQAADVFVLPSLFEGLPVTMIEAQAAGLLCIKADTITDECIVTDLVKSIPVDDYKIWVDTIMSAKDLHRTNQNEQISLNGYDIKNEAKKLTKLYLFGEL